MLQNVKKPKPPYIIHRKPGESIVVAGVRITVYVQKLGRATLWVETPEGIPVYRVDGESLTQLPESK